MFSLHGTPGCRLIDSRRVAFGLEGLLCEIGVRLITYDRPGYGRSDRHPGRRIADSAADVAAVADALSIDRFAIEGSSSGSIHALAAALLGERVVRVACVAPMAPYDQLGREQWSKGQDDAVVEYVGWCLEGEQRLAAEVAREDAQMRRQRSETKAFSSKLSTGSGAGLTTSWLRSSPGDSMSRASPCRPRSTTTLTRSCFLVNTASGLHARCRRPLWSQRTPLVTEALATLGPIGAGSTTGC